MVIINGEYAEKSQDNYKWNFFTPLGSGANKRREGGHPRGVILRHFSKSFHAQFYTHNKWQLI